MEIAVSFPRFFYTFWSLNFDVPEVVGGPGGFRKVREAGRMNFLHISTKFDLMVPSYDQRTKKVNDKKLSLFQCEGIVGGVWAEIGGVFGGIWGGF